MHKNEVTWQQFGNNIKNKTFIHEGKEVKGWDLPMHKQTKMYSEMSYNRSTYAAYINSGVKNV